MNVYLANIDDILLLLLLMNYVEIAFNMTDEVLNIQRKVISITLGSFRSQEYSCDFKS